MSSRSARNAVTPDPAPLVGRRIVASIGEPWDFTSTAGDNVLVGEIAAVSPPAEPVEWIICEVSPFQAAGATVSTVAAVRRYAGEEPVQQLRRRGEARVHLLYDPSGAGLTAARVHDALRAGHGDLKHLIGSLRLAGA